MAEEGLVPRPIFKKPAGESQRFWNNMSMGTSRGVTCQLCGTEWPEVSEDEEGHTLGRFLGLQFVEECCGRAVDVLYEEFGETFAMAFLNDFAENPSDSRFGLLRFSLPEIFEKARRNTEEVAKQVSSAQGQA